MNPTQDESLSSKKIKLTQYIFTFFLLVFVIVFALRFSDLTKFITILTDGIWYYILLFIFLQIVYLVVQSKVYLGLYRIFDKTGDLIKTIQVFLATNFVNLALPFSGVSGVITFVGYSKEIGLSRAQSLIVNIIFYILVFLSFSILILFILFFPNSLAALNSAERITIYASLFLIISLTIVFLIVVNKEKSLKSVIVFGVNVANYFLRSILKKEAIERQRVEAAMSHITTLKSVLKEKKIVFLNPFLYSFLGHLLHFLVLWVIFLSFGTMVSPIVALIGYVISVVFIVVSFTPSGIGIVEPLMILYFVSSGISVELATIATFVFRGVVFWLPFFLGFFAIRKMHKNNFNSLSKI